MLRIFNTLSRKVEEFKPLNPPSPRSAGQVGMYTCGPTVYDRMHIGNLRTFVFSDLLKRTLEYNGYSVLAVENITDIDDKIIKRATEKNISIEKLSKEFTNYFFEDMKRLNIPLEKTPRATSFLPQMIEFIKVLIDKGYAYVEKDARLLAPERSDGGQGSVYFDISKFKAYGKLSGVKNRELKTGTRILSDNYEKEDVQDFALWKSDKEGFASPWGKGRPGWHIECSVMSQKLLGEQFDLHLGGVDLIFPHHENEIAQSEAKTGKQFVNYFVHGAHMLVDGEKMSKSLNNFYTLDDLIRKGFDPLSLRYLFLQTHYRQEMNFTWDALSASQTTLDKLREHVAGYDKPKIGCAEFEERFLDAINNDLNMPEALAVVWDLIKSDYPGHAKAESLKKFDQVLGLNLDQRSKIKDQKEEIPENVQKLVKERDDLRKERRFHLADQLRNKIKKLGYEIEDKDDGSTDIKKFS